MYFDGAFRSLTEEKKKVFKIKESRNPDSFSHTRQRDSVIFFCFKEGLLQLHSGIRKVIAGLNLALQIPVTALKSTVIRNS